MLVKVWVYLWVKHRYHGSKGMGLSMGNPHIDIMVVKVWVYLWVKHRYHGSKGVGLSMGKTSISW